jgi:microcin C transport system permease protein
MSLVAAERFVGLKVTPLTARRLHNFRANTRGFWSTCAFLAMFFVTLPAEFVANDLPLIVNYAGHFYFPVVADHPETAFGGDFETATDYRDPT